MCRHFENLQDTRRYFQLSSAEFHLFNPNTLTSPIFRTQRDKELCRQFYNRSPILVEAAEGGGGNPWGIRYRQGLFHSSIDAGLFNRNTRDRLIGNGAVLRANMFLGDDTRFLPFFEAKMVHQFDHRFATFDGATRENLNAGILPQPEPALKQNAGFCVMPRYWIAEDDVEERLTDWHHGWLVGFRDVASSVAERTTIVSVLPRVGLADQFGLLFPHGSPTPGHTACLVACLNCLPLDYASRQKVGGNHLKKYIVYQLPVLPPTVYLPSDLQFIVPRVAELVYSAWEVGEFANDVWRDADENLRAAIRAQHDANRSATRGHEWESPDWVEIAKDGIPLPPFKWDEDRRAVLKADLDAYYAKLYGLTRKQLRYILDPSDLTDHELDTILDPQEDPPDAPRTRDFPGETFRVLKEKEVKKYGEYRTKRLVLEAWERLN